MLAAFLVAAMQAHSAEPEQQPGRVLNADSFRHYVDAFNQNDEELYTQVYANTNAWAFLKANIPLLDCPDKEIEETYYFRWWTFRKHIKQTPEGRDVLLDHGLHEGDHGAHQREGAVAGQLGRDLG